MLVSYSTLEMVAKRNYDCAIKKHLGVPYTIRDMIQNKSLTDEQIEVIEMKIKKGSEVHRKIEKEKICIIPEIEKTDLFEFYFEVEIDDNLKMNGYIDLLKEGQFIIDYKVSPNKFDLMQIKVYNYCINKIGKGVKEGRLINITPELKVISQRVVYFNKFTDLQAENWILTHVATLQQLMTK